MNLHALKALTIVFESILKDQLLAKVLELGASGYTLTETSGAGPRDIRNAFGSGNLKVEIICGPDVAEAIMKYISQTLFQALRRHRVGCRRIRCAGRVLRQVK